ncbi:MAG: inositol 2-dehydrogenase [Francisella sp.]
MKQLKVAIIGFGRIGRLHFSNIRKYYPNVAVVGVYDIKHPGDDLSDVQFFDDLDSLLQQDIDAVFVCSPTSLHIEHVKKAMSYNKHIFCEKPVGGELEKLLHLQEQLKDYPFVFQVGFHRRCDSNFRKLKEKITGLPHIVKIVSHDPDLPPIEYIKSSNGIFLDMVIHDFDTMRFLLNDDVAELYVMGSTLIDQELNKYGDVDTVVTQLRFKKGTLGIIINSRKAVYGHDQRIEVFSSDFGMLQANNFHESNIVFSGDKAICKSPLQNFFIDRYQNAYIYELQEFFSVISGERSNNSCANIDDTIKAVKTANAAKKSLQTNAVVKL